MPEAEQNLPRPSWSGTISFGLVSIPVSLYPATRTEHLPLRTLSPEGKPLRREYYCPEDETSVASDEIVRGYEVAEGTFVTVTDAELENLAPDKSRDIDLRRFVPQDQLSPAYFEGAHFMVPASESNKAYRLLAETLEGTGRVGVATFVMRGKEYVVAILSADGVLRAETMRFSDQLRRPADIGLPEREAKPDAANVRRVRQHLEKRRTKSFDAKQLENRAFQRAQKLVAKKLASGKNVIEAPKAEAGDTSDVGGAKIIDLIAALKKSLAANDRGNAPGPAKAKTPARPAKTASKTKTKKKASRAKPPAKAKPRSQASTRRAG